MPPPNRSLPQFWALILALSLAVVGAGVPHFAHAQTTAPGADDIIEDSPDAASLENETPPPVPPAPPRIADDADYDRCMETLVTDPVGATTIADALAAAGRAEPAQHCRALAQIELGNPNAGATMLDRLGQQSVAPPASRAEIFGQASTAWIMAANPTQALASAASAIALEPDDPDLRITRAIAAIAVGNPAIAKADLDQALIADSSRLDGRVLRATSQRMLGDFAGAQKDIDVVLAADSDNVAALLERGVIRQHSGEIDGARQDWIRVEDLAEDTQPADQAEQYLALLKAGSK